MAGLAFLTAASGIAHHHYIHNPDTQVDHQQSLNVRADPPQSKSVTPAIALQHLGLSLDYLNSGNGERTIEVYFADRLSRDEHASFLNAREIEIHRAGGQIAADDRAFVFSRKTRYDTCAILTSTTSDNALRSVQSYIYGALNSLFAAGFVTQKEISTYMFLHEFRHCTQPVKSSVQGDPRDVTMLREADADAHAIRAIEAKNPKSRIRDFVLAFRVMEAGYENALALKLMLEGSEIPAAAAMRDGLSRMYDVIVDRAKERQPGYSTVRRIQAELATDKAVDTVVRSWAQLRTHIFDVIDDAKKSVSLKAVRTPPPVSKP